MPRTLDPETFPRRLVPVLRGILDGKHNREIADGCGLTEHTVESYCSEIYSILECEGRTDLVVRALRGELGDLDKLEEVSEYGRGMVRVTTAIHLAANQSFGTILGTTYSTMTTR